MTRVKPQAPVLVDSSVWIDFFRSGKSQEAEELAMLLEEDKACLTSLVRAELLSGARNEIEFKKLGEILSALPILSEPPNVWDQIGYHRFRLARKGIQVSLADMSIAVLAAHHRCSLFTRDKIFSRIAPLLSLRLHVRNPVKKT